MLPLERDAELTAIGELFEAALGGRGGLMLLDGAPGLGKSTLAHAEDVAREHGLTVRRARGHELERAFAWGVAGTLLEPSLGDELLAAGDAAEPDSVGFAVLHALYGVTVRVAESCPLCLVVDDAHWADESSLRYLSYLLGRLADQPIVVLVGSRPPEPGEGGLLEQLATDPAAPARICWTAAASSGSEAPRCGCS